jgi:hypothetical protein
MCPSVPALLTKLQDPTADEAVLTEVAWALGKISDKRSIQPLYNLDKKLQAIRDPDNVPLKSSRKPCFGRSSNATPGISSAKMAGSGLIAAGNH